MQSTSLREEMDWDRQLGADPWLPCCLHLRGTGTLLEQVLPKCLNTKLQGK